MKPPHIPQPRIHPTAVLAPTSHVYGQVEIGPDVFVLFGAVLRAEFDRITVGAETNIQDYSVVHCDEDMPCLIGERVTVGHHAVIHGAEVGDRALIGIGARVLNRSRVGEGAWLAAGSILTEGKVLPPWTLGVGVPARPIRELTEDEVRRAEDGVQHYLDLAAAYREIFSSPS